MTVSDIDGSMEKKRKYGDPRIAFGITLIVILLAGFFVSRLLWKREVLGLTGYYTKFYPSSVNLYIDAKLNPKDFSELNRLSGLKIKSLPDILSAFYGYKNERVNIALGKALGDDFSFGMWKDNGQKRSLAIFPIDRESKVSSVFEAVFKRESKVKYSTLRGFKVTYTAKAAYLNYRDMVFVADSRATLKFVMDNFILKSKDSLSTNKDFQKFSSSLDKSRVITLIFPDLKPKNNLRLFKNSLLPELDTLMSSINYSESSVLLENGKIKIKTLLPVNYSNKPVQTSFCNVFKSSGVKAIKYLPENTAGFVTISKTSNLIEFVINAAGLNASSAESKNMIKMLTGLDYDKEVVEPFNGNAVIIGTNLGFVKPKYILIIPDNNKADVILQKLTNSLKNQFSDLKPSKITYNNVELTQFYSKNIPVMCFGMFNKQFIFGDKMAVISFIDKIKANKVLKSNFAMNDAGVQGYIDVKKSKKYIKNNVYLNKIIKRLKTVDFSLKADNSDIKSEFTLNF